VKKIAIIINGLHGLQQQCELIINALEKQSDFSCTRMITKAQGDAYNFTQQAILNNYNVLIAIGGDGTVNEVVNGIMNSHRSVEFAILPNGTGNDFVKSIQQFETGEQLIESILKTSIRKIDVGNIIVNSKDHYFLNIADIGFGGKAIHLLNRQRKWIKGTRSYPLAILRTFLSFRRPTLKIKCGENRYTGDTFMIAICNGRVFGSGITINPMADPGNGVFEITVLKKINFLHYLKYLNRLKRGELIHHPQVEYWQGKELEIISLSKDTSCEADGESIPTGNYTIKIIPEALQLLQPH
jgi:diacylglycerol kinase (ATP)